MLCPHGTLKRKCEICERDDIIEGLKEELSLNAKMLSRQTDLAREAEIRVMEFESKEIGCKKVIEEFKKINPTLENKLKEAEDGLKESGVERRQDALDGQAALDEANNRVVELEQENDTLIDHNIRLIGDNTALKKSAEELENANEVLQGLLSAEREMHSRDTVDFKERLEKAEASLAKLRMDIIAGGWHPG